MPQVQTASILNSAEQVPAEQSVESDAPRGLGTRRQVEHESDLEWFFCAGESLFEASTFGAVLERQAAFGHVFDDCQACAGSGFTDADGTCGECNGMGGKPLRLKVAQHPNPLRLGSRCCDVCKGSGQFRASKRAKRLVPCKPCAATGTIYLDPVGQKAIGGGEEPSYTPDDAELMRFARVSRWLVGMHPGKARILEAYYGLSGYRWGSTKWGRLFAVLPFTAGGHSMLAKAKNPLELSDHELLGNMCAQSEQNPDTTKRSNFQGQIMRATVEANGLFGVAVTEWNRIVSGGKR